MDNYEINILRRGGNWKKVKPDDLVFDTTNNISDEDIDPNNKNSQDNFVSYVTKVNSIILKLETLEMKNKLKDELKSIEHEFLKKKKLQKMKLIKFSGKEIIDKTINT